MILKKSEANKVTDEMENCQTSGILQAENRLTELLNCKHVLLFKKKEG